MATFKEISASDVKSQRSFLEQLVDVIQQSISGSSTRRKYQVFITGGLGPGVTSSLFQTVNDQDFTLQTSNPVFDMTVGLYYSGSTVLAAQTGEDASGKPIFPSNTLMMREKIDTYKQFAQSLLGDSTAQFVAPFTSTTTSDKMNAALFIGFKRLFFRDKLKRETYAMTWYKAAATTPMGGFVGGTDKPNTNITSVVSSSILTDFGASGDRGLSPGGEVGNVYDSTDVTSPVGLIFYDKGVVVLDLAKVISGSQHVSGVISYVSGGVGNGYSAGQTVIGAHFGALADPNFPSANPNAKFIPDFMVSGSMDDIIDHFASCRFSSGTLSAATFQNLTTINSTLYFCRASADEFNYSSNPTFVDSANRIVVIDEGQEDSQSSFTFVTTIGLYDANDNLLAVGKVSRPIEKNSERDLTVRLRLDY